MWHTGIGNGCWRLKREFALGIPSHRMAGQNEFCDMAILNRRRAGFVAPPVLRFAANGIPGVRIVQNHVEAAGVELQRLPQPRRLRLEPLAFLERIRVRLHRIQPFIVIAHEAARERKPRAKA